MTNHVKPYRPVHPGEVVKDEIDARFITQKDLARVLDVPYTMLNEILNGKRNVSVDMALLFESALGIDADMLVAMQAAYSLQVAREDKSFAQRMEAIKLAFATV